MRLTAITVLAFLAIGGCSANPKVKPVKKGQAEAFSLLKDWCDALIRDPIKSDNPSIDGGIICAGCARIYGHCTDAILPLMYVARHTGDEKY